MHLTYETNEQLLAEMLRIDPGFKPDGEYYFVNAPDGVNLGHKDSGARMFFESSGTPALTPADLIRFLQWNLFITDQKRTGSGYMFGHGKDLITCLLGYKHRDGGDDMFIGSIFLSQENFEAGAKWLISELKKIK